MRAVRKLQMLCGGAVAALGLWAAGPVFAEEAWGAHFRDVDGLEYVDLCLGDTGAMTGHSPPEVVAAVAGQAAKGITLMLPSEDALWVGEELTRRFGLSRWQFALTATDCQPVGFYPEVPKARGSSFYNFQSAIERGGGPDLDGVALTASSNVKASLPRALRGRKIGTLFVSSERAGMGKTYTLKGASTALSRGSLHVRFVPGTKRFLRVTGLPAGIKNVQVRLVSGITQLRSPRKAYRVTGSLTAGDTTVSTIGGGTYA